METPKKTVNEMIVEDLIKRNAPAQLVVFRENLNWFWECCTYKEVEQHINNLFALYPSFSDDLNQYLMQTQIRFIV